jgi:hypothetical protein
MKVRMMRPDRVVIKYNTYLFLPTNMFNGWSNICIRKKYPVATQLNTIKPITLYIFNEKKFITSNEIWESATRLRTMNPPKKVNAIIRTVIKTTAKYL